MADAGALTERLTLLTALPVSGGVTSVTRTGTTATVTTTAAHGYVTGDYVTHAGATQADYNGEVQVTVTGATTYTFPVAGSPTTPATGTITSVFTSDASGGSHGVTPVAVGWRTFATVWGSMTSLSASELIHAKAIGSLQTYIGKICYRPDVTPKMRIGWRPYKYTTEKQLEIHGVQPDKDEPRRFLVLDVGEVV